MKIWSIDREREYSIHENFSLLSFVGAKKIMIPFSVSDVQTGGQTDGHLNYRVALHLKTDN